MQLKKRSVDPLYVSMLDADFEYLFKCLKEYEDKFIGHLVLDPVLYQQELKRIRSEWAARLTPIPGGRTLEKDLADLYAAFETIKAQQVLAIAIINQLIGRLYEYWNDIYKDQEVGYLNEKNYQNILQKYKTAIEQTRSLNLTNWDKPGAEPILKNIDKSEKDKALEKLFKKS